MSGKVYFVSAPGRIKIGFTKHPEKRFAQLRAADMEELEVLGIANGTRADERGLHDHLQAHNLRGEWFLDNEHVREAMDRFIAGSLTFTPDVPPQYNSSFFQKREDDRMKVVNTAIAEVRFLNEEIALRMSRRECATDLAWFAKFLIDQVLSPLLNVPEDKRLDTMFHDHGFDPPQ